MMIGMSFNAFVVDLILSFIADHPTFRHSLSDADWIRRLYG